jgi:hypothetical protein
VDAVAAIGQVGLHVTNQAAGRVHGQTAEVVQRPRLAGLHGNARLEGALALMRFIAEQLRFGMLGA